MRLSKANSKFTSELKRISEAVDKTLQKAKNKVILTAKEKINAQSKSKFYF